MLAGTLLLALAWHYRLDMYLVLGRGSAIDGAFTSLDHRVGIPASRPSRIRLTTKMW